LQKCSYFKGRWGSRQAWFSSLYLIYLGNDPLTREQVMAIRDRVAATCAPTWVAAIDVGSNSFHLLVAQQQAQGLVLAYHDKRVVRLRAGLQADGTLSRAMVAQACQVLREFRGLLAQWPITQLRAVATATLRQAQQDTVFIKAASLALGAPIEIISGEEEAHLTYLSVARTLSAVGVAIEQPQFVMDVGGGSTECMVGQGLTTLASYSFDLGCVALQLRYFPQHVVSAQAYRALLNECIATLSPALLHLQKWGWQANYATAGTLERIVQVAQALGLGSTITLPILEQITQRLLAHGTEPTFNLPGLAASQCEIFPVGLAILTAVVKILQLPQLQLVNCALRHGLLLNMLPMAQGSMGAATLNLVYAS
jgi:exopolyphosphatase/guanosine-5'-triphosphate,3'-diphosphate pyrophosphatase